MQHTMAKKTDQAVTLADVARRAGTSTAVVSYVINDGPRPVAAATRARVLAARPSSDIGTTASPPRCAPVRRG